MKLSAEVPKQRCYSFFIISRRKPWAEVKWSDPYCMVTFYSIFNKLLLWGLLPALHFLLASRIIWISVFYVIFLKYISLYFSYWNPILSFSDSFMSLGPISIISFRSPVFTLNYNLLLPANFINIFYSHIHIINKDIKLNECPQNAIKYSTAHSKFNTSWPYYGQLSCHDNYTSFLQDTGK